MNYKWIIIGIITVFLSGMLTGFMLSRNKDGHAHEAGSVPKEADAAEYTCSMHPQIRQPGPGDCPICGMDLIPVKQDSGEKTGPREIKLSEHARKLAEIETEKVKRTFVPVEIRMTGSIVFDETRLAHITARMNGRIDRMYANYTGVRVNKGEHMVYFYSPSLMTAQEELLQALKSVRSQTSGVVHKERETTLEAARTKLNLWGISKKQIKEIEQRGTPVPHMTINAPLSGIVVGKHAEEGTYVQTGTKLYTIADLSRVWVYLDAYESDIQMLKYGQPVEFRAEAYPGDVFKGRISFIDPVLDPTTRTVKVRVTVDNSSGKLKPGMFVRSLVKATVTEQGAIVERDLAGKWISPMHPEVIKDKPGTCDVCGMDLVRAETLGYVDPDTEHTAPLVVPASAPLITGRRAVVYVRRQSDTGIFQGREVVLGPRAGDYYIVTKGLRQGEEVAVKGNFKIDSALQIRAQPSMMSAEKPETAEIKQTVCPVMGGKVNKDIYVDYQGKRIYFCCKGCDSKFKEDPEKYMKKMKDQGMKLEDAPLIDINSKGHEHHEH